MVEGVRRGHGLCPISETLADRVRRPGLVLPPLHPPLRIPPMLAWRGRASRLLDALADALTAAPVSGGERAA